MNSMRKPENQILVIFGASGDLTYRKLVPSLYDLYNQDMLADRFIILGVSRTDFSVEKFRDRLGEGIKSFANLSTSIFADLNINPLKFKPMPYMYGREYNTFLLSGIFTPKTRMGL